MTEEPKWDRRFRLSTFPACARPRPIARLRHQACADWILLDIADNPIQFRLIPHLMIERFVLPEGLARTAQYLVGSPGRRALQPTCNYRQTHVRLKDYVNMIGHDYPGLQKIELPLRLAVQESAGNYVRDARLLQPDGAEGRLIGLAVHGDEGLPCGFGPSHAQRMIPWKGTSQAPCNEEEGILTGIRNQVGKLAAVKHGRLTGENACLTQVVRCLGISRRKEDYGGKDMRGLTGGSACPT